MQSSIPWIIQSSGLHGVSAVEGQQKKQKTIINKSSPEKKEKGFQKIKQISINCAYVMAFRFQGLHCFLTHPRFSEHIIRYPLGMDTRLLNGITDTHSKPQVIHDDLIIKINKKIIIIEFCSHTLVRYF